jgi:hypothetical protein
MAGTTSNLPDDLKQRLERLAANAQKSPHAFMIQVLACEAERIELREHFAAEAAESDRPALSRSKTFALNKTFGYVEKRVAGSKTRRPKARAWRTRTTERAK